MNFGELKNVLAESVNRSDMEYRYPAWINRALLKIQQDNDWSFMRQVISATIPAGQTSVSLPASFKSLTQERVPIYIVSDTSGGPYPCEVNSRNYSMNMRAAAWPSASNTTASRAYLPVFLSMNSSGLHSLNIIVAAGSAMTFDISCYAFLDALTSDSASNVITTQYEDLVEAKAKTIAFTHLNDPLAEAFETAYQKFLKEAINDDWRRLKQGRAFRMGG